MDLFEAIQKRRSVRRYTKTPVPDEVISRALEAALLAPNSSNTQTWDFYWVKSPEKRQALIEACLSQSAARMASQLVVVTADPKRWKRSHQALIHFVESVNAPKQVILYYRSLVPFVYRWGILNTLGIFKWLLATVTGFFRPIMRGPHFRGDIQEVAIKSAALAAENFVLAITAQGFSTCMMEGFDERRVSRLLGLGRHARVVMVISVGEENPDRGLWGPRFRIPSDQVIHRV